MPRLVAFIRTLPIVITIASLAACNGSPTGPSDLAATEALISALKAQGATVVRMEQMPAAAHCLSVGAVRFTVNGENVYVFEYESADAAASDASAISLDGGTINRTGRACSILWIGPPRFYKKDELIVLYVGSTDSLIRALDGMLGSPFAGR